VRPYEGLSDAQIERVAEVETRAEREVREIVEAAGV
ncbi:hypothetical protein LCGC14_1902460, partial [marine sediment metagenome]